MSDSDFEIDDEDQEDDKQFTLATAYVASKANVFDARELLPFYALYKQATEGICCTPRPSILQLKARTKWNAWQQLGDMSKKVAQKAYVDKLNTLEPDWVVSNNENNTNGGRPKGWVVHSTESAVVEEQNMPEHLKTIFDHVKENNLQRLREQLQSKDLALLDDQGMSLLHWATDRNSTDIIKYLVECGASVDQLDEEHQTPLHYAASCGHVEALRCLLALKANVELCDASGQTCLDVADDEQICALLQAELHLRQSSSII